ncbi:MAG: hypothetical protein EHM59_14790 [Betaproteobacteria bacterium]|nr:MAG: hypothetical protein EHM59_14790 [Betaproteobacteria bacterium]
MAQPAPVLIDADQALFIAGGVGMSAAACRPGALPNMARCTGCRVSPDRRAVTLLIAATPGAALLDDIRRTAAIAAVFSQPSTHHTLQLKGSDARIVPLEAGDHALAERYVDAFVAELAPFGYPEAVVRGFLACAPDDLAAVQFTISAAFSQTPGPHAGEPLSAVR